MSWCDARRSPVRPPATSPLMNRRRSASGLRCRACGPKDAWFTAKTSGVVPVDDEHFALSREPLHVVDELRGRVLFRSNRQDIRERRTHASSLSTRVPRGGVQVARCNLQWRKRSNGANSPAAARQYGTPAYVAAWQPVHESLARLESLTERYRSHRGCRSRRSRSPGARRCVGAGRRRRRSRQRTELPRPSGSSASPIDRILVNGVAKHTWLSQKLPCPVFRVHFDSLQEIAALTPDCRRRRAGVSAFCCQAPDERDYRDPAFRGQFGLSRHEAVQAI